MTGIQLAHAGQCVKNPHKKEENCPKNCDKAENKIVCGSDGNAYRFTKNYFSLHTENFVQKFDFDFPRKIVELFWVKTRENAAVLDFLAVDNFDFMRKIVKKKLGEKLVKMLGFCQN